MPICKRYIITDIIGKDDGLGVENLRGSGTIAGESSQAYEEIITISMVRMWNWFLSVRGVHVILCNFFLIHFLCSCRWHVALLESERIWSVWDREWYRWKTLILSWPDQALLIRFVGLIHVYVIDQCTIFSKVTKINTFDIIDLVSQDLIVKRCVSGSLQGVAFPVMSRTFCLACDLLWLLSTLGWLGAIVCRIKYKEHGKNMAKCFLISQQKDYVNFLKNLSKPAVA